MGLGKADCEALAREGAKVIVTDREVELAHKVADAIGGDAMALDVTSEEQWIEVMRAVEERHGGLDILVNNAGNVIFESIEECSLAHFKLHLDIHVVGTFLGCKYAVPLMKRRHLKIGGGGSSIINMASTAALMGYGNIPAYAACKAGIAGMTRSLAMDFQDKGYGIRVNALAPGFFPSKMTRGTLQALGVEKLAAAAPLKRIGDDDDLKGAALLFASAAGKHITGQILAVDGGVSAVNGG
jgi:3(or 17)beta-hydroxysteroid dehydrogenase